MKRTAPKGWHCPLCQASPPKLGSSVRPVTHPLPLDFPAQPGSGLRIRFEDTSILGRGGWGRRLPSWEGRTMWSVPGPSRPRGLRGRADRDELGLLVLLAHGQSSPQGIGRLGQPCSGRLDTPRRVASGSQGRRRLS